MLITAWEVSVFKVFLVHIFPHLDWIRRDTPYAGKYGPVKIQIRTLFQAVNIMFLQNIQYMLSNVFTSSSSLFGLNPQNFSLKNYLYFPKKPALKNFWYFFKKNFSYISGNGTLHFLASALKIVRFFLKKAALIFRKTETPKKSLNFRKQNFLIFRKKLYSEPKHI